MKNSPANRQVFSPEIAVPKINRFHIIQLHMYLAAFLLPLALMYFISGALYTADVKGSVDKQMITVKLAQPFTPNLEQMLGKAEQVLADHKLPLPDGEPLLKKKKGSYELSWGDLQYAVKYEPTSNPMVAKLTFRERSALAQVMRIHRADAGVGFKVFAIILVAGLLLMFASGVYMAMTVPKFRKPAFIAMTLGLITFLGLMLV